MFGFVLVMTAAFFGSPAIASDLETGVAQAMLARPLPRSSYLIGRWLGLAIVIVVYAVAMGLLAIGVVGLVSGYVPPDPILPVAYLAGQALVLLSLTVLLSTRLPPIAGGAIAVVAFGLAWMAGVLGKIGLALGATSLTTVADASRYLLPTDALWQGVVFGLEPSFVINAVEGEFARSSPFFAAGPPPVQLVAWSVIWVVLVLALAVTQLRRREL
jgi:ABC-type transport system involved in multi-copper enzyme maturation permease subunit